MSALPEHSLGRHARRRAARSAQLGMGMIELLIVILISMFMMAGVLTILYGTRQEFTAQNQLAQLQDSERLAITLVSNVVETSGYFPNPGGTSGEATSVAFPSTSSLTASNGTSLPFIANQVVGGTGSNAGADQIWSRYTTGGSDDIMDCNGQTQSSTTQFVNYLYLSGGVLYCQAVWITSSSTTYQTAQPLVAGVTAMNVLYGVNTGGVTPPAADTYMTATQVAAGSFWNSVVSVQVQLTFNLPAIVTQNGTTGATMFSSTWTPSLTRTIDLLNHT